MVTVVNVVGSGQLKRELDLHAISSELSDVVDYDPSVYPGAYFRLDSSDPLVTIYTSGKFIISGGNSEDDILRTRDEFLATFVDNKILTEDTDEWFSFQNFVCSATLSQPLDLSSVAVGIGLEYAEYEPEQFPGLVYRPPNANLVILLFTSGEVILTGCKSTQEAEVAFEDLQSRIDDLFLSG